MRISLHFRRLLILILAAALALALGCAAFAAETTDQVAVRVDGAAESRTLSYNNYRSWSAPEYDHLFENADGTLTRVEYIPDTGVVIELWTAAGEFISGKTLAMELPLFGGAFAGESCNFLVFGQRNSEEDDEAEVLRIVKYSKDWERLDSLSIGGANTTIPFRAGSLRMTETAGLLVYPHLS